MSNKVGNLPANLYLVSYAKRYDGIVETTPNRGPEIDQMKISTLGKVDDNPWCAVFAWYCIKQTEIATQTKCQLRMSALVQNVWSLNPVDYRVVSPQPGDLILWNFAGTSAGHMGIVIDFPVSGRVNTIEGNTSPAKSIDREGDGVYIKNRSLTGSTTMRVMGFLRPFKS